MALLWPVISSSPFSFSRCSSLVVYLFSRFPSASFTLFYIFVLFLLRFIAKRRGSNLRSFLERYFISLFVLVCPFSSPPSFSFAHPPMTSPIKVIFLFSFSFYSLLPSFSTLLFRFHSFLLCFLFAHFPIHFPSFYPPAESSESLSFVSRESIASRRAGAQRQLPRVGNSGWQGCVDES